MHFVPENELAFDASALGFPSIFGCQAICLQTSRGLYGFHDLKSAPRGDLDSLGVSTAKLSVFADWVRAQLHGTETLTALYGVINRGQQYSPTTSGNADWRGVLLALAGALGFAGDVYGARINSHVEKDGSVYVQFDLNGGVMSVGYKRWSKLKSDNDNKTKPDDQEKVVWRGGAYSAEALYGEGKVAPVIRRDPKKGFNLKRIAAKEFFKFQ